MRFPGGMRTAEPPITDEQQQRRSGDVNAAGAQSPTMTRALTVVFAVAAGGAVGNLYWAHPLLALIGGDLHVSASAAGLLVTVTQIGYAAGMVLIVPLGDGRNRRRLIVAV